MRYTQVDATRTFLNGGTSITRGRQSRRPAHTQVSFHGSTVHPSHVGASVGLVNRVGHHAMTRPHRGKGLSAEVRERRFEPFFTTRRDGTVLRLAVCYGRDTAHGGTIRAEARAGGGSQFVVDLPDVLVDEESEKQERE